MKRFLLGAAAFLAFAAPALAADMPARTYTKAPAYTAPQVVYNWTGFYIGGHVGGAFAGNNSLKEAARDSWAACRAASTISSRRTGLLVPKPSTAGSATITTMAYCS